MEYRKVYVDVFLSISRDGYVRPRRLRYEDGPVYDIEALKQVHKNTASYNVGGLGDRYTVIIHGQETHLFFYITLEERTMVRDGIAYETTGNYEEELKNYPKQ